MQVIKRDGTSEPVDFNKILRSVERAADGLADVDPALVAKKVIDGLHDGVSTRELDVRACREASGYIALEPNYSKLAARVLAEIIAKEAGRDQTFWQTVERLYATDHLRKDFRGFVKKNRKALEAAIDHTNDNRFDFFGLSTVYDRYLLKDREGKVIERPQHWLMRVAIEAGDTVDDIIEAYQAMARGDFLHATPTLFNSGTKIPQLSSCYLTDVPDSITGIFRVMGENAELSKYSGGLGADVSRMRAAGSHIKTTKGASSGPIPFIRAMDAAVKAVDQGGKRRGAMAVYMRSWHANVFEFLELRDTTGDHLARVHDLWTANWVPDVFMQRVKADGSWSLFDPVDVPEFFTLHGEAFTKAYEAAEAAGKAVRVVRARELYKRMMKTLAETGSGWISFQDHVNRNHPQVEMSGIPVASSNLCVHGDTWVMTSDGPRQAKNLVGKPFEAVVNGVPHPTTSKGFWCSGRKQVFKVTTKKGYAVTVSEDHPFLSEGVWAPLRDLKVGDKVALANHSESDFVPAWAGEGSRGEGWMLGSLVGDGCFTMKDGNAVAANLDYWGFEKEHLVQFAEHHLGALHQSEGGSSFTKSVVESSDKVRLTSQALVRLAAKFGLTSTSNKHTITKQIEEASSEFQRGFLAGLFDADGTVSGDHGAAIGVGVRVTSVSEQLLEGVQRMLSRFGVESTIYKNRAEAGPRLLPDGNGGSALYECQATHDLHIGRRSLLAFAQHVGFASAFKAWQLQHKLGSYKRPLYKSTFESEIVSIEGVGEDFVYDCTVPGVAEFDGNGIRLHNCTEICESRNIEAGEIANCNLGSVNVVNFVNEDGTIREPELRAAVKLLTKRLDRVIDRNFYPVPGARSHNLKWRNIGLGQMGFYDACMKAKLDFASPEALALSNRLAQIIWEAAVEASEELAAEHGPFPAYTPVPSMPKPRRNSLLIAIAPTASIGSIIGVSECTEPRQAMLFRRKTLSGEFVQVNTYLVEELKALGLWSPQLLNAVIRGSGSIQAIEVIPEDVRARYKTAWEISGRTLLELAAGRYPFIDQAQSLNLFMAEPHIGKLSSMYMTAWEKGIKTTYYLKSKAATENQKVLIQQKAEAVVPAADEANPSGYTDDETIACSIINREACEACQ